MHQDSLDGLCQLEASFEADLSLEFALPFLEASRTGRQALVMWMVELRYPSGFLQHHAGNHLLWPDLRHSDLSSMRSHCHHHHPPPRKDEKISRVQLYRPFLKLAHCHQLHGSAGYLLKDVLGLVRDVLPLERYHLSTFCGTGWDTITE